MGPCNKYIIEGCKGSFRGYVKLNRSIAVYRKLLVVERSYEQCGALF